MKNLIHQILKEFIVEAQLKWTEETLRNEAKKYTTAKEFRDSNFSAYNSALKKGKDFFNDITSHMTRLRRGKYSDDELRNIAKQYQTKTEFLKASSGGYDAAMQRGKEFYDDITSHMIDGHAKPRKYSDETLKELISNYTSLSDFRNEHPGAYDAILKKSEEVRNEFYKNLTIKKRPYSKEDIINISKDYTTLKDFWDNQSGAAVAAKRYGEDFFNEVTKHMTRKRRDNVTDDDLINIAKQYKDLTDFYKNEPSTYSLLGQRGLLKTATAHLKRDVVNWTKDDLITISKKYVNLRDFRKDYENLYAWGLTNVSEKERKEIFSHFKPLGNLRKRLIYSFEFPDKSVYVGLTFDADGRYKQHQKSVTSAVNKYGKETGLIPTFNILTEYVSDEEAVKMEYEYVNQYRNNGWRILNIAKTGGLGSFPIKWTIDILKQEALKYKTRVEFLKMNPKAYGAALRYKIMDDITKHMGKRKNEKISTEYILSVAKQYKVLKDFVKDHQNLYTLILQRGLIDQATSHMERQYLRYSDDELNNIAKKYKTKAEFIKDNNLAYTQAFRRGILDDITSHYKKTREKWTEEKIKNVASNYQSVSEFKKTPAYQAAHRMGILDDVTKHMTRGKMFGNNTNRK
jgi:predicted GIY-YIG superfamily endonuclease